MKKAISLQQEPTSKKCRIYLGEILFEAGKYKEAKNGMKNTETGLETVNISNGSKIVFIFRNSSTQKSRCNWFVRRMEY